MTKEKLSSAVEKCKDETQNALQTLFDAINQGQRKQLLKNTEIKKLFDTFGVEY